MSITSKGRHVVMAAAQALAVAGCVGEVRSVAPASGTAVSAGTAAAAPGGRGAPGGSGDVMTPAGGPAAGPSAPPPPGLPWPLAYGGQPSALRRLTRDELVASVSALVGVAPVRGDLPEEPRTGHGPLLTTGLPYIATELPKIRDAMAAVAAQSSGAALAAAGCAQMGAAQQGCLTTWAAGLAQRAFRRPLRPDETTALRAIAATASGAREDDLPTVEALLRAVLFAPSFLYRLETGTPVAGRADLRGLDGYAIAVRLSYLATLSPPDAALADAAQSGRLQDPAERARQFDRLVATDRGRHALSVFVLEWLGANESKIGLKSPKYLAGLGAGFESSLRTSAESAIQRATDVATLLSTDSYMADPAVQKVRAAAGTGVTATGDAGDAARLGLMMHPWILSAHTKEDGSSPFQIGSFMRDALLCEPVPPPPPNAAASAPTDGPAGASERESLEYRTSGGVCSACHKLFAPFGYAFLPFDPVGRWRRQDPSGKPWDLSGSSETYSGRPLAWQTPTELVRALAAHPQVHGCFAQTAVTWALGRALVKQDDDLVLAAAGAAARTGGAANAVLSAIVAAPGFVNAVAPR